MYPEPSRKHHQHPSPWLEIHHYSSQQLPVATRQWLLDRGSLTRRLIDASDGDFEVKVLQHGWQIPRRNEMQLLAMRPRQRAIVREVALCCKGQPWVFARSVIPVSALSGNLRRLRKFDNSSLGAMLFRARGLKRMPFQITRMAGRSLQLPATLQTDTELWGRRCRFELQGKAIMVSEIFLPAFRP